MKYTEKISNKLNELLIKNFDAEKRYLSAIDNVNDDRLKMFFKRRATDRSKFAKELRIEILRYGQIPEDSGSLIETLNRNWLNLKSILNSNDEELVLEAAIKFEESILEDYNELLKDKTLPPSIDSLLLKHKNAIQGAINTEKSYKKMVS
ncbi:PA2169 family four-helix-bundle protein [Mariniflexile sp. HNIBRBA6329]|uniref:ferritin-like domain-containing protein n=1 Tax=Mariniflexile sp. HNIBRBA6329 TaxID=3373088 RepID=UPI0037465A1E